MNCRLAWVAMAGLVAAPTLSSARVVCETTFVQDRYGITPLQTCRNVPDAPLDPGAQVRAISQLCDLAIKAYGEEQGRKVCQGLIKEAARSATNP